MKTRIILGAAVAVLAWPATASAHHLDTARSSLKADCTGGTVALVGFRTSDGNVSITARDSATVIASAYVPAFYGDKLVPLTWPALSKGTHTVTIRAEWPTRGSNNGTYTATVVCPGPPVTPPVTPPPVTPPVTPPVAPPITPVAPAPPVTPPTPPVPPAPPAPPAPPCAVGKMSRIHIVRDGHQFTVRGRELTRVRWLVNGKRISKRGRTITIHRFRGKHIVQAEAIAFGCLKVSAFRTIPRPPTPIRFTG